MNAAVWATLARHCCSVPISTCSGRCSGSPSSVVPINIPVGGGAENIACHSSKVYSYVMRSGIEVMFSRTHLARSRSGWICNASPTPGGRGNGVKTQAGPIGQEQVSATDAPSGSVLALACAPTMARLIGAAGDCDNTALRGRQRALAGAMSAAGVEPGSVVAIIAERTPDTVAAILAILGLGAAYLPLDPQYPRERLAMMLADARPMLLLGRDDLLSEFPGNGIAVLSLDSVADVAVSNLPPVAEDPAALAYVLFTSGSTGRPHGAAMRRGPAGRLIDWHVAHPRQGMPARPGRFAPLAPHVSFQRPLSTFAPG